MTRKLLGAVLMAALGATMLFAQSGKKAGKKTAAEQKIRKTETEVWQAFKDHDAKPVEEYLTDDSLMITDQVVRGKANIVKFATDPNCHESSFSLSPAAYTWLNNKTVIATYTAKQDGSCGSTKMPEKVNASTLWVKRGSKWLAAFHQESPAE